MTPAVNQIEIHPRFAQVGAITANADLGIVAEAWSPLGAGNDLVREPAIVALADLHGVTCAQVVLRWHVQRGTVPTPKSGDRERQAEF